VYGFLKPFVENPSVAAFLEARAAVFAEPGFNPWSSDLDGIEALLSEGDYDGIVSTIRSVVWPHYVLSPGVHLKLGFALSKIDQEREANVERALAALLLRGIEMTGDGTEEQPLIVSRVSDEYDFLFAKQLRFVAQLPVESDGRRLDRIEVDDGDAVFFDVTDLQRSRLLA
jgi:hypothetical protein